jgi:hypothetical protein
VRRLIGEPSPSRRSQAPVVLALAAVPALLALGAAEPVVEQHKPRAERPGVEAYVVLDTSGSMAASLLPSKPARLTRAKEDALALRYALPDIRFGIASMTDRTLPNLFPTGDAVVFNRTLAESVDIEQPPPLVSSFRATALMSLGNMAGAGYYTAPQRFAIVFTDGESDPIFPSLGRQLARGHVNVFFVHVWQRGERIWRGRSPDRNYRADPGSERTLARAAQVTGSGRVFGELDTGGLISAVRAAIGGAKNEAAVIRSSDIRQVSLTKWFVLGALAPLAFVLWRRNIPWELRRRTGFQS